ncbi:hypothetical protein BaRGS_00035548, partial [Batillaria attramentaria]
MTASTDQCLGLVAVSEGAGGMQVAYNRQFCLGLAMDSNDNLTGALPQPPSANSTTRTWKDFSPPTSVRRDSASMGESGNANTKLLTTFLHTDGDGETSNCLDSGISSVGQGMANTGNVTGNVGMGNTVKLEQKVQIVEGPVIRMGTGALTSRREGRNNQPDCLPVKSQAAPMATWKDVSPPKEKMHVAELSGQRTEGAKSDTLSREEKNRNSIRTNPFHEGAVYRGTDNSYQSVKRIKTDDGNFCGEVVQYPLQATQVQQDSITAVAMTTWRDVSPTKVQEEGRRKRPESGYFSNDVQSEGGQESRDEIDTSLSDTECGRKERSNSTSLPTEEACFHSSDYFYEDEFSVQFDTNLRDAPAGDQCTAEEELILPHSLNGSYTKFGGLRDSMLQTDLYLGPYESELSGSRTSMEISSSEREMMCSSDMLNFSNDPLFTPTPPPVEHQQNLSVDSLSHQGQGYGGDMGNSRCSNDANLAVDCCIRKDAYFLSFNGSQEHRSTSESEISCVSQTSSQDGQRDGSRSDSSHAEDAEDECSNSFQFQEDRQGQKPGQNAAPPTVHYRPVRNMLLSRYPGRICLEALQEYLLDRSHSTKSPGSSRHSCSSNCKLSPLCGTLLSSGDLCMSGGVRRGLRRSSNLTTWKQVKNLRKLGKEANLHQRSRSLPDLTADDVKVVRREKTGRTVESMAESFHTKRHSAYILELYQQLLTGSNPPSPTTLGRIDQILFQEHLLQTDNITQESRRTDNSTQESRRTDCQSCQTCTARGRRNLRLDFRQDAQCGRSQSAVETEISPHTLTLWYGQKNFSSQFPPNTSDCGVQTSVTEEDEPTLNHRSMQTSPASPGADLIHMLNQLQAREGQENKEVREPRNQKRDKPAMTRAKSATECHDTHAERLKTQMRRTVSLSPSRIGMNSFYTHQSLPDLSFLSGPSRHLSKSRDSTSSAVSLFDPVQIPIVLTPVIDDASRSSQSQTRSSTSRSSQSQTRSSASSGCGCVKDHPNQHSSHQPTRRRRRNSGGKSGDLTSSGSNYSLSSSSGIDPGYVDTRSHTGLAPELEHLLFLPPHLESAFHQLGLPDTSNNKCDSVSCCSADGGIRCVGHRDNGGEGKDSHACMSDPNQSPSKQTTRMDRYTNEAYPGNGHQPAQGNNANRAAKQSRRGSNCSSSGSITHDRLCALREEKTPSPEPFYCHYPPRDYSDYRCFGCHSGSEGESSQELDEEKLEMYQRWLQERKPPLKSCLRKRYDRDQKARSLSLLTYNTGREEPPEKPPRRQNRHSIACDGMFPVLVDEEGFECQHTNVSAVPQQRPLEPEYLAPEFTPDKVVLRRKKQASPQSDAPLEGSSQDEINRAKRVSFASEVSFHSPNYTPQSSPHRQPAQGDVTAVELEDDILTLHVVRRGKTLHSASVGQRTAGDATPTPQPTLASDGPTTQSSALAGEEGCVTPSPWEQKAYTLINVIQTAEALVRHFAQARDPFDKTAPLQRALLTDCPVTACVTDKLPRYMSVTDRLPVSVASLRLLDFWMGYISSKESIVGRFYEDDAILCVSRSRLEQKYQDVLLALQPLAVLPFQIDYDVVASYSLADSAYMGESDFDPSSPKKSDLSSSPKVVIARSKMRVGSSPDRASWCGASDRTDSSFTRSDRLDFSATWDWIKTTTLPKARSLMSDMGLMSSSPTHQAGGGDGTEGSVASSSAALSDASYVKPAAGGGDGTEGGVASSSAALSDASYVKPAADAPNTPDGKAETDASNPNTTMEVCEVEGVKRRVGGVRGAKTSRLSQDLASVGIISSRHTLSSSASTLAPAVDPLATETTATQHLDTPTPAARPLDSATPATQPLDSATPATQPLDSATPATQPLDSVTPATQPLDSATPATQPLDSATPATQPLDSATPATQPLDSATPATQPLDSATPATQPLDLATPATQPLDLAREVQPVDDLVTMPRFPADGEGQGLPAVVMDHGARQQTDKSARQRAEDILRRKGEKRRELSPLPSDKVEKKLDSVPDNGVDHRTMLPGNQPDFSKTRPITNDDKDRKNDDTGDKVGTSDDTGADDKASTTNEKGDDAVASLTSLAAGAMDNPSTATSTTVQSEESSTSTHSTTSPTSRRSSSVGSKLSGLKRLSPRSGSFNIISFFDRLLLPSDKAQSRRVDNVRPGKAATETASGKSDKTSVRKPSKTLPATTNTSTRSGR